MSMRNGFHLVALLVLVTPATSAQTPAACSVTIAGPKTGERLGPDVLVTGTASVPTGRYLWTFSHRRGLSVWWPQGGAAASVENGQFAVLTTLGVPQDVGSEFEIRVQVVDGSENSRLDSWFKRAETSGSYQGMSLPPSVEGCGIPPRVVVIKSR
jgi:hypothetical protein